MESTYIGKKVFMRDGFGEYWEGTVLGVFEELGYYVYRLKSDDGLVHHLPCTDINYIRVIKTKKAQVIPIKSKIKLVDAK